MRAPRTLANAAGCIRKTAFEYRSNSRRGLDVKHVLALILHAHRTCCRRTISHIVLIGLVEVAGDIAPGECRISLHPAIAQGHIELHRSRLQRLIVQQHGRRRFLGRPLQAFHQVMLQLKESFQFCAHGNTPKQNSSQLSSGYPPCLVPGRLFHNGDCMRRKKPLICILTLA